MWFVRNPGGKHADELITRKIVSIGWSELGDLRACKTPADFYEKMIDAYPDAKPQQIINGGRQLYKFYREMSVGDDVVTYDISQRLYHLGKITGDAVYDATASDDFLANYRSVDWLRQVPRDSLPDAIKSALGPTLTIFKPSDDAQAALKDDAVSSTTSQPSDVESPSAIEAEDPLESAIENSKELIKDRLVALSWQQMQFLVAGILRAMGYKTRVSADGADRGKDIIASPDALMLEHPRIFVEVKHRKGPMGASEVRRFIGGRDPSNDRCVYVSTNGFSREAHYEAERSRVPLTLIDSDELVELYVSHYDDADAETRALLPLRKTYWPI